MKKGFPILAILLLSAGCISHKVQRPTDLFSSDNGDGTYTNPVINADYPDPDIIRVGEDYYMVSSSFVAMPGIPVCHSKDLINWKIIGHAYESITFRPQYSMQDGETAYSRLCWAPTIRYRDGIYYIGVNIADDGFVMFKSDRPEGPYSMHKFDKRLYDPGFFIDDDGKKYVTHGKTKIYLTRLKDDGTGVLDPEDDGTLILIAPEGYEPQSDNTSFTRPAKRRYRRSANRICAGTAGGAVRNRSRRKSERGLGRANFRGVGHP